MPRFDDSANKQTAELQLKEAEALAQVLSKKYQIPYIDLSLVAVDPDALRLVTEEKAKAAKLAAFARLGGEVSVAVIAPEREDTKLAIQELEGRGYKISTFLVSEHSLEIVWGRYADISSAVESRAGVVDISAEEISDLIKKVSSLEDVEKLLKETMGGNRAARISRIFEVILAGGIALKASDIHIEPEEAGIRVRFRLDGVLVEIVKLDSALYKLLLSRLKLLSGVKLNVSAEAQDGRFSVKIDKKEIEIRTSIIPGAYSESVVLRILNPDELSVPLKDLGIPQKLLSLLEIEIKKPNGLVLTTGPTGSGKTTTLYAFLKLLYTPEIKIMTIEDPIEYHIDGVVQTQVEVDKGYSFADGLRAALRQNPNILMVGEIRDDETARTAIDAAETGHLVFSTLHTNSAAGTFPRLLSLGVNPKIISSALNIAMAQRLCRKLCIACKKQKSLEGQDKEVINKILAGVVDKKLLEGIQNKAIYEPVGCPKCNKTGYKGRIGLFEAITVDEAVEKAVLNNPSERDVDAAAKPQGMPSMAEDGAIKVLSGIISLPEVARVVDLSPYGFVGAASLSSKEDVSEENNLVK